MKTTLLLSAFLLAAGFGMSLPVAAQPERFSEDGIKIVGRVISGDGPVSEARVRVAGEDTFTLTDTKGYFASRAPVTAGRSLITAGKEGWFNNGTILPAHGIAGDIFLNPVFLNDNPDYRFYSPQVCFQCHGKVTQVWDKAKMAHTTSNPKLLDMYYGTNSKGDTARDLGYRLDNPGDEGNCAVCHAPSAAASGRVSMDLRRVLASPRVEWDGISCEYCHKVRRVVENSSAPSGFSPLLERQSPSQGRSILVFGPYDDVVVPPMAASYNSLFDQGRFCSTCHSHRKQLEKGRTWNRSDVYSDEEWAGFGFKGDSILPIQTTFQEWSQWQQGLSDDDPNKGKKCQQCHMSWQKKMLPYEHFVVDGGARRMWGTYRSPESIRPHHFEGGTQAQLQNALAMELEADIQKNRLNVKVHISNTNGGHWVPTGETMRNVLLLVEAQDSGGKDLKLIQGGRLEEWAGNGSSGQGAYAGRPGAMFARVLADDEGNLNVPFWRATRVLSDTRIRPKKTVTLEFVFELNDPEDEPEVEAKLIYRPVVKPLAELKGWQADDIEIVTKAW